MELVREATKRGHPDLGDGDPRLQEILAEAPQPMAERASGSGDAPQYQGPPGPAMDQGAVELMKDFCELHAYRLNAVDVAEIFNPTRFVNRVSAFDLVPGSAFDLRTGWNLSLPSERRRCWAQLEQERPALVI